MYIVIDGCEVRYNDITNGRRIFPVSIIRVGKIIKQDKDAFKRMNRGDGTYYYPRTLENELWKKGKIYFKRFQLIG